MWEDQIENGGGVRSNVQKLLDIELIFGLHYILPFLELVHMLIKYAQRQDVYICDFVEAIKMCKSKMYELYNDLECKFKDEVFNGFHRFLDGKHEVFAFDFHKIPFKQWWLVCHKVQWSYNLGSFLATNH